MDDYNLQLITAPLSEPITLAEAKLAAHISHGQEDDLITSWIKSGRQIAEDYMRRAFINQVWEMSFDEFPKSPFFIARAPFNTLLSIKYYDSNNTEATLYEHDTDPQTTTAAPSTTTTTTPEPTGASSFIIDTSAEPGRVSLAFAVQWPAVTLRPIDAVKVRFGAGYGPTRSYVPEYIKDALKLYVSYRNETRAGEGTWGVINPGTGAAPRQFYALLEPNRMNNP